MTKFTTAATLTVLLLLGSASVAVAAWSASGAGSSTVAAARLMPVPSVSADASGSNVTVSWTGASLSTGDAAQGYLVSRSDGTTEASAAGTCAGTVVTTTCTESVVDGTYVYRVTPLYASFWTGAPTVSNSVSVVAAPLPALTFTTPCPAEVPRGATWTSAVRRPAGAPTTAAVVALSVSGTGSVSPSQVTIPASATTSGTFTFQQVSNNGQSTTTVTASAPGHTSATCTFVKR